MPLWLLITLISVAAVATVALIGAIIYKINKSNGKEKDAKKKGEKENTKEKENEKSKEKEQEKGKNQEKENVQETTTIFVNGVERQVPVMYRGGKRYAVVKGNNLKVKQVQDALLAQQNNVVSALNVVKQQNLEASNAFEKATENLTKSKNDLDKKQKEAEEMSKLSSSAASITKLLNSLNNAIELPETKKEVKKGNAKYSTNTIAEEKNKDKMLVNNHL